MQNFNLGGNWSVARADKQNWFNATVPGCIHTDLLAAGKIEDSFYRDNEEKTFWVGETDWVYVREFVLSEAMLAHKRVLLRCDGLDTLAEIKINGSRVGKTDNMFRTWEFDVKKYLRAGENHIEIGFRSPFPYLQRKNKKRRLPAWGVGDFRLDSGGWIRKEPCNFGWDWGPRLVTCGIWRAINIVAFDTARLDDIQILQDHAKRDRVGLDINVCADIVGKAKLNARITVKYNNRIVAEVKAPVKRSKARCELVIKNAKLWWPNNMGAQPLYEVTVDLVDEAGVLLDARTKRIGLRTLELVRKKDKWGESFHFAVNGVPFFAKGANWIPADTFATRVTRDDYNHLLVSAADANMNMLRVWGGGIYEDDSFYNLCDELGLCVWQEFMFACATYPAFDKDFMDNVREEACDNVKRLRHHPCVALWCGNNELEMGLVGNRWNDSQMSWSDYKKLFDKLLPSVVKKHDPQRTCIPGSPHSPRGRRSDSNNPNCGDAHLWGVWFELKPFEWYRTTHHRFCSEFGFQSFPEPKTVRSFTKPEDKNISSYIMEYHQRSPIGNSAIMTYMLDWFQVPKDFGKTLMLSQIQHGMAMKYAVEHWRRNMPRCMGALYWQINDCWPAASWASIDSRGRWKGLHYMARHFYAPVMVSGVEDAEKGTVKIYVTSDLLKTRKGKLSWRLTNATGRKITAGEFSVTIPPNKSRSVEKLNLLQHLEKFGPRDLMLWLELDTGKDAVSTNFVTFGRPKHLKLQKPEFKVKVSETPDGRFIVQLKADKCALWTWLELSRMDAHYSDNFFHVRPGRSTEILVCPQKTMTASAFEKQLKVRSLIDTYK